MLPENPQYFLLISVVDFKYRLQTVHVDIWHLSMCLLSHRLIRGITVGVSFSLGGNKKKRRFPSRFRRPLTIFRGCRPSDRLHHLRLQGNVFQTYQPASRSLANSRRASEKWARELNKRRRRLRAFFRRANARRFQRTSRLLVLGRLLEMDATWSNWACEGTKCGHLSSCLQMVVTWSAWSLLWYAYILKAKYHQFNRALYLLRDLMWIRMLHQRGNSSHLNNFPQI